MGRHRSPRRTTHTPISTGTASLSWDGPEATLFLNDVESSCINVDHPEHLAFEYMQHFDAAVSAQYGPSTAVKALHIGGAACALAWAWSINRPSSRQVAVEVDEILAHTVRTWFDLPSSPQLRIRVGDGRQVLSSARPQSWDVIVRDAFSAHHVPRHLTTKEAAAEVAHALRPGGLYLANAVHGGQVSAHGEVDALERAFPYVCAIADPKVGRSGRYGNIVFVAQKAYSSASTKEEKSRPTFNIDELDRLLRRLPLPARVIRPDALSRWRGGARCLTDADITMPADPNTPAALKSESSSPLME